MTSQINQHDIAIIGGGPGGLTLARLLQLQGADVVLYERDSARDARQAGGTLDMHTHSGQRALVCAGLEAEFRAVARPEGQGMRIMNKAGHLLWQEVADENNFSRPEIDRGQLRELLINSLATGSIKWGHRLVHLEQRAQGGYRLHFDNAASVQATMVIGAEGANSLLRSRLTAASPVYSGVSFIETTLPESPSLVSLVGSGSFMALADNKGLIAQRNSKGTIRLYIALRIHENAPHIVQISQSLAPEARQQLLSLFTGWSPTLTRLIDASEGPFILRPIHMLPLGTRWPSQPGLTLLGDAAHLMSPFAGEGANQAMLDALELAHALRSQPSYAQAIAQYEASMFTRTQQAARESAENLDLCMAPDGAENLVKQMNMRF